MGGMKEEEGEECKGKGASEQQGRDRERDERKAEAMLDPERYSIGSDVAIIEFGV